MRYKLMQIDEELIETIPEERTRNGTREQTQ